MKKLKSTWYNMVIVLTLICTAASGVLAYVNKQTEGPIAEINQKNLEDGIRKVLGDDEVTIPEPETLEDGTLIYRTEKGVAVQSVDPQNASFGGGLTVLTGFDTEGNIKGYTILKTAETPGLGAKADTWFQEGQKGSIIGMNPAKNNMTVSKDGGEVDAITASTITSRAFLRAVNAAFNAAFDGNVDTNTSATAQNTSNDSCNEVTVEERATDQTETEESVLTDAELGAPKQINN